MAAWTPVLLREANKPANPGVAVPPTLNVATTSLTDTKPCQPVCDYLLRTLANGRVEVAVTLGDFPSVEEAEKVAKETMLDLAELRTWYQLEWEAAHSDCLSRESVVREVQDQRWQMCESS